jgi:tRNA/rRNA methyltransferase
MRPVESWPISNAACASLRADGDSGVNRAGLRVVLVSPKRGANVGAACRAIKNMGASGLVVVGGEFDAGEARRTAVHADDVFDARVEAASFEDAVAACGLVIGTTSRDTPWSIPVEEIGDVLAAAAGSGLEPSTVALVFGPEDRGLSNEELSRCHRLAFVPTAGDYASLNLAQAVVVSLYEWLQVTRGKRVVAAARDGFRGEPGPGTASPVPERASAAMQKEARASASMQKEARASASTQKAALDDLREVLVEIDFLHGDQSERVMATIASMLTRSGLAEREVSILRGMVRQIRWAARRPGSLHGS